MEINSKVIVLGTIGLVALGATVDHFLSPTKIKTETVTKIETKTIHDQVNVDRVIDRVINKDGTVTEVIKEQDRSKIDSIDKKDEKTVTKEITNPKNIGVALAWKSDILNIEIPTEKNFGVQVYGDTGILNSFVTGSVFMDGTVMVTLGVKF